MIHSAHARQFGVHVKVQMDGQVFTRLPGRGCLATVGQAVRLGVEKESQ